MDRVDVTASSLTSLYATPDQTGPSLLKPPPHRVLVAADEWLKRGLDVVVATILLLALSPLLAIIALAVAIDGGPVFFSHRRVGRRLTSFECLKFRTMMLGAEPCLDEYLEYHPDVRGRWHAERKLDVDPRITRIGNFLRRTSLDELPQLFNVLRGEMSLVGPRPVTEAELHAYETAIALYAAVRPGITGAWQISGRSDTTYAARVLMDTRYVLERTIWTDVSILMATPRVVLSRRGAR